MKRIALALGLLAALAVPAMGWWTVNTMERGYVTAPVHLIVDVSDSMDVYPPVIGVDTLDVRGFMLGLRSTETVGQGYGMSIRFRQKGDGGWERWQEWLKYPDPVNLGMPLIGDWQPSGSEWEMALTPFIPLADIRLLRLLNPSSNASMQTVVIWFIDHKVAEDADWSVWDMEDSWSMP